SGHVVYPASGVDGPADVLIEDGQISDVGQGLARAGATVFDAAGCLVLPGLIDMHVHLREPGFEAKETIATGTAAAAAGGFTTICCMPNTRPALDSVEVLRDLAARVERDALVPVLPIAAITEGRRGERAVDFAVLAAAGAIGFSDDGDTTADSSIMRAALEATLVTRRPVMTHCEDKALAHGAMHEGDVSAALGVAGIPPEAEEIIIARDLMLARLTGGWLHVCHVSTARGIDLIRRAKAEGVNVTAEVMPHHLTMDDRWVAGERHLLNVEEPDGQAPATVPDPQAKVNPPLRTAADARALLDAMVAGDFDVIATDHAPHTVADKTDGSLAGAAMGMSGLELAVPLVLALVRAGHLSVSDLVHRLSREPARLLRLSGGNLAPGRPAHLTVIDPDHRWVVGPDTLRTKSPNTPLLGMTMRGKPVLTLVGGEERYRDRDRS
ncbi:MAG: dihydroorotase, partial [Chloroflexota bacterium]|nr:dihydroorotase [Chloroflexota bacterium]